MAVVAAPLVFACLVLAKHGWTVACKPFAATFGTWAIVLAGMYASLQIGKQAFLNSALVSMLILITVTLWIRRIWLRDPHVL